MHSLGNSTVLSAGRLIPRDGLAKKRGVAVVLSGPAITAWKLGGCQWKAWSSRLVSATLEVGHGDLEPLHVLSCYSPTFAASTE